MFSTRPSSRALRNAVISGIAFLLLLLLFDASTEPEVPFLSRLSPSSNKRRLHLLVVATASNLNLCRLLLSSSILSYPEPVFVDWEGEGEYNASATHLAKVAGPLRYLKGLPKNKENDLVLLVDGYDLLFQFDASVLLKRYFAVTARANARLRKEYGRTHVWRYGLRDTILFGPDKVCWPHDFRRPACWMVPNSTLPEDAYGVPLDRNDPWDMERALPRWLNSGTIMGPAGDMRAMFEATSRKINLTYDGEFGLNSSDQMYLADVWADQNYARKLARFGPGGIPEPPDIPETRLEDVPEGEDPPPRVKDEFLALPEREVKDLELHMGLDYESQLFQTIAGNVEAITWETFNRSDIYFETEVIPRRKLTLPKDVLQTKRPFANIKDDKRLAATPWTEVPIGINAVTSSAFPILHFTGDKILRDLWWNRTWYYPYAERLLYSSAMFDDNDQDEVIGGSVIGGVRWIKDRPYERAPGHAMRNFGAWSDQGEHLSWSSLCSTHEQELFDGVEVESADVDHESEGEKAE